MNKSFWLVLFLCVVCALGGYYLGTESGTEMFQHAFPQSMTEFFQQASPQSESEKSQQDLLQANQQRGSSQVEISQEGDMVTMTMTPHQMGNFQSEATASASRKTDALVSEDSAVIVKAISSPARAAAVIVADEGDFRVPVVLSAGQSIKPGSEVHVVSGYRKEGSVEIIVDRPGKDVLLVLAAYEPVHWMVRKENALSVAVLTGGYNQQAVSAEDDISVYVLGNGRALGWIKSIEDVSFVRMLNVLQQQIGVGSVHSFTPFPRQRGRTEVTITGISTDARLARDWPQVEKGPTLTFMMPGGGGDVKWTPAGPVEDASPLVLAGEQKTLALGDGLVVTKDNYEIQLTDKQGTSTPYPLPANFPRFSWAKAMAYSSPKGILAIASFGGEGFFYRFDVHARKWIDVRSLNNLDIDSLVYDPLTQGFVGTGSMTPTLVEFSCEGQPIQQHQLNNDMLPGLSRMSNLESGQGAGVIVLPLKTHLIIAKSEHGSRSMPSFGTSRTGFRVKALWVVDRKTGRGTLTYRND